MNDSRRPRRRFGTALAALMALGGTLVALAATGTAALASIAPPPEEGGVIPPPGPSQSQVTPIVAGGMPGWEITLIAIGAALAAAVLAVLADRALSARRRAVTAPGSA